MRLMTFIGLSLSGAALMGCAATAPSFTSKPASFDSVPTKFASAAEQAKRDEAAKIKCNTDASKPTNRTTPNYPFEKGVRSGKVKFIFDLDDFGMPIKPGEPASKRMNICSSLNFTIWDDEGREIPTWPDVEDQNETYNKYKTYLENRKR